MRAAATHQIRYYEGETIIPFTGINITNLKSNPSSVSLESVWRRWRVNYSHTTIIVVEASIGASPPHPHANKTTAHHPDTASKLGAQNHWHFITLFSSFSDARENIIVIISIFHKFVSCCCCCRWFFFPSSSWSSEWQVCVYIYLALLFGCVSSITLSQPERAEWFRHLKYMTRNGFLNKNA